MTLYTNMTLKQNIFKDAVSFYLSHFALVCFTQIPLGLLVLLQRFLDPFLETHPIVAVLILLPLFSIGSSLGTAFNYLLITLPDERNFSTFLKALRSLDKRKMTTLTLASLMVAIFFSLGLAAFVLPGLYFMALYFFVPILVISNPKQPVAQYLYSSKKLVTRSRKTFFATFAIVLATFLMELPISFFVNRLSELFGYAPLFDIAFSVCLGGWVDVFICFYFLTLKQEGNA
jgi:hypothetical protein